MRRQYFSSSGNSRVLLSSIFFSVRAEPFRRFGNGLGRTLPTQIRFFSTLCQGCDLPVSGLRGPASGFCPRAMRVLRPRIFAAVFLQTPAFLPLLPSKKSY